MNDIPLQLLSYGHFIVRLDLVVMKLVSCMLTGQDPRGSDDI